VHAPSLAHAATAAVLRSGQLAHDPASKGAAHPLAIELDSDRVRLSLQILDGVRQGQPLGALLGYRFERALHERKLHSLVLPFRALAPLASSRLHPPAAKTPIQTIAANTVVDGEKLLGIARAAAELPWGKAPLPAKPAASIVDQITDALEEIASAVDALSDLVMAESVFHAVRGNPLRSAAASDSVSGAGVLPNEIEVIASARSGIGLTHRLMVICADIQPGTWPTLAVSSPRSDAEPRLDGWVGSMLGDPARIMCRVDFVEEGTGALVSAEASLADAIASGEAVMQIGPLDLVYAAVITAPGDAAQRSDLEERIVEYFETIRGTLTPMPSAAAKPIVTYERPKHWRGGDMGLVEIMELARAIRDLLGDARALRPEDFARPGAATAPGSIDFVDLDARATSAMQSLRSEVQSLIAARDSEPAALADLRGALFRLAQFGVPGATPSGRYADSADEIVALRRVADSIEREMTRRESEWQRLTTPLAAATSDAERLRFQFEHFAVVFGREFRVLPQFSVAKATDVVASIADASALHGNDDTVLRTWLQRCACVRPGASRLRRVLSYADAAASAAGKWNGAHAGRSCLIRRAKSGSGCRSTLARACRADTRRS
jgi:hypothetical protein